MIDMVVVQNFVNVSTCRCQYYNRETDMNQKLTFLFFGTFYELSICYEPFIKNGKVSNSIIGTGIFFFFGGGGVKRAKRWQEHKVLVDICGSKNSLLSKLLLYMYGTVTVNKELCQIPSTVVPICLLSCKWRVVHSFVFSIAAHSSF